MTSAFSWQNSISLCPASFCTPKAKFVCYFRCFLTSYFCIPVPYNEKDIFLGVSSRRSHRSSQNRSTSASSGLLVGAQAWITVILNGLPWKPFPANMEIQQWPQDWKRSVFIPIPKKGNAKECSNYHTIALISRASKVMLKIRQARLQQYVNHELPDVQAGFRRGRGTRDQIANIRWIMEKAREFQKASISAVLTMPKPLTVWITINCGKF